MRRAARPPRERPRDPIRRHPALPRLRGRAQAQLRALRLLQVLHFCPSRTFAGRGAAFGNQAPRLRLMLLSSCPDISMQLSRLDYRRRAFDCLARANAAEDAERRAELLSVARMWMQQFEPM